jgi:signal transduction histidine kinase/DNA-binding response OmpR family regulator
MKDKIDILVVDDLPDKLMALETVLSELGENVVCARSGREALRHLLERDFAVILLDVNMPDMDGFETAALIRQRRRSAHTPIIFVTAYQDELNLAQGYSLGAVDYILSPILPDVLRTKVAVFAELFRKTEQIKRQAEERVALAREQAARTAAEEATRRSQFLAEASRALVRSLDFQATLESAGKLVVPFLGDLSAIALCDEQGGIHKMLLTAMDVEGGRCWQSVLGGTEIHRQLMQAFHHALQTGRPERFQGGLHWRPDTVSWPGLPAPGAAPSADSAPIDDARAATLVIPVQARGKTMGVLAIAMGPSGRSHQPADFAVAEDLAGRIGIALDNARLYRDIQEADRRKNEFLNMLAHELRNPLAPIRNAVEILRLQVQTDPNVRWAHDVIERQVEQMVRLVDDLLDVSRITHGKITLRKEMVEVATVVARAIETSRPLIDVRRHDFTLSLMPEPLVLDVDPTRLAQVLANILNNAAKYTGEGGRISLRVGREEGDVVFRIRDNGIGIPPEMLSQVFELFTQVDRSLDRSEGGLGIGLTVVRRLVEMHGGSVRAYSAGLNQGSEFVVRIPMTTMSAPLLPLPGPTMAAREPLPAAAKILLVDDNIDAADSLGLLLRSRGHEICIAYDGHSALQAAGAFRPDFILLDIGLPGMNGYDVARALRRTPELEKPILVAVTGYGNEADVRQAMDAGFDHHLVKPVNPEILPELFTSLLARRGKRAEELVAASPNGQH